MFLTLILFDTKTHYLFDKNRNKIGPFKERRLRYSYAHADVADVLEADTLETRKRECATWTRGFGGMFPGKQIMS